MGRPTGVSDAHGADWNVLSHMGFEVGDFAFLFLHTKLSPPSKVAIPALSYPRYSSRVSPSMRMG